MALWTPAEITTEGWFDAADAGTITLSGSEVTQWADKSGRGITTANVGGNPLWGDYGGYKAVRFSGAEYMNMSLAVEGVDHIFAFVVRKDSTAGRFPMILGGANNINLQFRQLDAGANLQVVGNPVTWGNTTLGVADPGYNDVLFIFNGASSGATLRTNGSFDVTGGTQTGSRQYARIGARDDGKDRYKGEIREIIVFSDASSVEKIEGYLAHNWGLTANLPADHPYKTTAPQVASTEATGTGAAVTAPITATGTAEREVTATGNATTAPATASGSGGQVSTITGAGTATTAPATASGTGEREVTGTGTASTSPATANGTAEREITATGSATTAPITASGTGGQAGTINATGEAVTAPIEATGTATREVTGQGNVTLSAVTAAGEGQREVTGTGNVVAFRAQATGTAKRTITGAGQATTASITATGQVARTVTGQGVVYFGTITASGQAGRVSANAGEPSARRIALVEAQNRTAYAAHQVRIAYAPPQRRIA